jgi:hypothetical protein
MILVAATSSEQQTALAEAAQPVLRELRLVRNLVVQIELAEME